MALVDFVFILRPAIINRMSPWTVHFVGIVMAVAVTWALWRTRNVSRPGVRFSLKAILYVAAISIFIWYIERLESAVPNVGRVSFVLIAVGGIIFYTIVEWLSHERPKKTSGD